MAEQFFGLIQQFFNIVFFWIFGPTMLYRKCLKTKRSLKKRLVQLNLVWSFKQIKKKKENACMWVRLPHPRCSWRLNFRGMCMGIICHVSKHDTYLRDNGTRVHPRSYTAARQPYPFFNFIFKIYFRKCLLLPLNISVIWTL